MAAAAPTKVRYRRPWLYDKQRDAIFHDARYGVIEASTKAGKTVGCIVWLNEQAMAGSDGQNFWWVAPVYPQTKIAYRRYRRALYRAQQKLREQGFDGTIYKANDTELMITLANGAVVSFKSGEKPDNLYGEDVYAAVVDEATRVREESWFALRSTLTATRGPVRIIGNVKGRKNWAYRLARRAESGEPDMLYAKLTAWDAIEAGVLDAAEIADARATLPAAIFKELYEAEPGDDEGNPFGIQAIAACVAPLSERPASVFGWDLAKSIDWTVGIGLDSDGRTAAFERWQAPWSTTVLRIRSITGRRRALVDSTGVGDPVVEELQKSFHNIEGYKFSPASKQQLMEGLAVAIQQREITFPDGPIRLELENFEYEYTRTGVRYSAPEGLHDDCVIALALAVEAKKSAVSLPQRASLRFGPGSREPQKWWRPSPEKQQETINPRTRPNLGDLLNDH